MKKNAFYFTFLGASVIFLQGCETAPEYIQTDVSNGPTCQEIRAAFRETLTNFKAVALGPEVSKSSSTYKTQNTSLQMRGASSCIIRRSVRSEELYCRWDAGENRPLMGAYYRAVRDQIKSCIKVGEASQNDRQGYTWFEVDADSGRVKFQLNTSYQQAPYYVYLTVSQ